MTDPDGTVGFTGVEWEQRTPADLARALSAGPGPGQAGELAAAWSAVADELEAVASEYRRLAVELSAVWVSAASPGLDVRSREVADDVFGLAAHARGLTERAGGHAHDHTIARATMPRAEEIEATDRALAALDSLGPGLAGVLTGATDALETRSSDLREEAATVMALYEARTAPLEVPRERPARTRHLLPGLVARAGGAEGPDTIGVDHTVPATGSDRTPAPASGPVPDAAAPLAAYAATAGVPSAHAPGTQVRPATVETAGTGPTSTGAGTAAPSAPAPAGGTAERTGVGMPMIPPVGRAAGASGGTDDAHHADEGLRPTAGPTEVEELYGLSVAVAPPVFGATTTASSAGHTGGGNA